MTLTKSRLKQRISAIAENNLESAWGVNCWESKSFASLSDFLSKLADEFELPNTSYLLEISNLDEYETPWSTLDFLWRQRQELNK